jgi:fructose-1,6-bisphosphatase/inositol monophosphatase family enzyme
MMELNDIEKICIDAFRGQSLADASFAPTDDPVEWLRMGLTLLMKSGLVIREMRLGPLKDSVKYKKDGSPATRQEKEIEILLRDTLARFCPEAHVLGEESGGSIPSTGLAVAIDPIDGTWALLNRMETCATSLIFLRDRVPFLGMVLNPVTGELGYAFSGSRARLVQFSIFGEQDVGCDLPLEQVQSSSVLVNVHPQKKADLLTDKLFHLWRKGGLNMVRMPGGSPSFALLEAAKGSFSYVNLWSDKAATAYDLLAGILIVRGAGGDVVDLSGKPVRNIGHSGPFVAGIDAELRGKFVQFTNQALDDADSK